MASYADTRRNTIQYKLNERMNMPEFKMKPSPTISLLKSNAPFLVPAKEMARISAVKESDSDSIEINILDKQAITPGTARAYNHTGSINDSTSTAVTFVSRTAKFKYSMKQADRDSVFALAEMNAAQFRSAFIALHENIETYMIGLMNTNKSQVSATPTLGTWDGTNYIYQVAQSDKEVFFQRLKGFMRENYYPGMYQLISNEPITQWGEYLFQQGGGNNQNLQFQLSNISPYNSVELANAAGAEGTGFLTPSGTVAMLDWIPKMNREGFGNPFQNGGAYYNLSDPFGTGITFAVHEYATGADNQSAAGERQDIDVEVEVSTDVAFVAAPMTTSNASPIFKVELRA